MNEFVEQEMEKLKSLFDDDSKTKSSTKWSDLTINPGKRAIIGIAFHSMWHFSGTTILMMYTATIFKSSGSVISENESALLIAFIQFIGASLVPIFID